MLKASYQPRTNVITLPAEMIEKDVVSIDSPVFWAYDSSNTAAVFTQWGDELRAADDLTYLEQSKITRNRVTSVPTEILDQMEFYVMVEVAITDDLIGKPSGVISTDEDAFWTNLIE
ncbi:hypothetical protein ACFQMM_02375 [Saliphagus sp. GCM10025308]